MRKLSRIAVKNMQILSAEEMAQIEGGAFTVEECDNNHVGDYCALDFGSDNWVQIGICSVDEASVTPSGWKYTYACKAFSYYTENN